MRKNVLIKEGAKGLADRIDVPEVLKYVGGVLGEEFDAGKGKGEAFAWGELPCPTVLQSQKRDTNGRVSDL